MNTGSCCRTLIAHEGPVWALVRHENILVSASQDRTVGVKQRERERGRGKGGGTDKQTLKNKEKERETNSIMLWRKNIKVLVREKLIYSCCCFSKEMRS